MAEKTAEETDYRRLYEQQKGIAEDLKTKIEEITKGHGTATERIKEIEAAKAAADADLAKIAAEVGTYRKRDQDRADKLYDGLSDETKARLEPIKGKLDLDTWLAYVEREAAADQAPQAPQATPGAMLRSPGSVGKLGPRFRPHPDTVDTIEDGLGREVEYLPIMQVTRDPQNGMIATIPIKEHIKRIKSLSRPGTQLTPGNDPRNNSR